MAQDEKLYSETLCEGKIYGKSINEIEIKAYWCRLPRIPWCRIVYGFLVSPDIVFSIRCIFNNEIQAVKLELSEATKSLNAVWDEVQSLKQKNKVLQEQCDSTMKENGKLIEEVKTLKTRLIQQEDYSRRENVRFYNIPENRGESNEECSSKVMEVLAELGADPNNIMFHAIHRTGNPNNTASSRGAANNETPTNTSEGTSRPPRPRPILARFVSRMGSDWVWGNRKKLMNSSHFSSVFIDKDLLM